MDKKNLDIVNEIGISIKNNFEYETNIGIMKGIGGILLFNSYANKILGAKYVGVSNNLILEYSYELIKSGKIDVSYSSGLIGYLWSINHASIHSLIEEYEFFFFKQFNDLIAVEIDLCISNNNFDFLYGLGGISNYIFSLSYSYPNADIYYFNLQLKKIFDLIRKSSKIKNNQLYWTCLIDSNEGLLGVNMGYAHGILSTISFLCKYFSRTNSSIVLKYLSKSIDYILSSQNPSGISIFPTAILEDSKDQRFTDSRLGWCYGDLSVCYVLLIANIILKRKDVLSVVDLIIINTSKRLSLKEHKVSNSCLCHGAFGVFMMVDRISKLYRHTLLDELKLFWYHEGFLLSINDIVAYNKINVGNNSEVDLSLAEGLSGIGLSIISKSNSDLKSWTNSFLI